MVTVKQIGSTDGNSRGGRFNRGEGRMIVNHIVV
jgi:hypothetical protein